MSIVRVIEGGGKGFRRTDFVDGQRQGDVFEPMSPIDNVKNLVEFVARDLILKTDAIAFSLAGIIENHNKVVISPNLHFLDGLLLGDMVRQYCGKPTFVANDMEAAVTGMSALFPDLNYFLGMTWSSGVGLRIWKNGAILSDSEGGHMKLDPSSFAPLCGCGRRGCVESIVGGVSATRRVMIETQSRGIILPSDKHPLAFLDESYVNGESWAIETYVLIAEAMGSFLANLQTLLHLPAVVWKGSFAQKALPLPGIEEAIRCAMHCRLMNPSWEKDVAFYLVPKPPVAIEDSESLLGAAKIAEIMLG